MSSNPELPSRNASPSRLSDRSTSSSPSIGPPDSPQNPPWRRETVHLTPNHRPPSRSPSRNPAHPYYGFSVGEKTKWEGRDPRSSSMQSLLPVESAGPSRRTLLLIYIHGFLGNETSFRSFPAHVHNVLTVTLSESHVVHTKVYPRYRSRKPIEYARDDFSNWLTPHETPDTDVILVGHSLGGILAAEVALLQPYSPRSGDARLHRILGLLAFDTPFLGMHPGVVSTGIASLFRPKLELPVSEHPHGSLVKSQPSAATSTGAIEAAAAGTFSQVPSDPNYNPPFPNDNRLIQRKGLDKALYFFNKHSDRLVKASKDYVTSHLEFGGCLADYPGLKRRYAAIRELEDVDELSRGRDSQKRLRRRVRFVNYYSASTGRLKRPKAPGETLASEMKDMTFTGRSEVNSGGDNSELQATPRLSVEEYRDDGNMVEKTLGRAKEDPVLDGAQCEPDPHPFPTSNSKAWDMTTEEIQNLAKGKGLSQISPRGDANEDFDGLPPIPSLGPSPPDFDSSKYMDPDNLRLAQQDHAALMRRFERAKRDREKSIREREKLIKKREKAVHKEAERVAKMTAANQSVQERQRLKRAATLNPEVYDQHLAQDAEERKSGASTEGDIQQIKKQRDRKFCTLPSKDPRTGTRDPTWIRIYMEGVDEVTAHTSLFIPEGTTYEKLVGDAAERIEKWIKDEQGVQAALQSCVP